MAQHRMEQTVKCASPFVRVIGESTVAIRQGAATHMVPWSEIIAVQSENKRTWISTTRGTFKSSAKLADVVDALANLGLVRIHRGSAVNATRVRQLVGHGRHRLTMTLDTGDELVVGRRFQRDIRSRFGFKNPYGE